MVAWCTKRVFRTRGMNTSGLFVPHTSSIRRGPGTPVTSLGPRSFAATSPPCSAHHMSTQQFSRKQGSHPSLSKASTTVWLDPTTGRGILHGIPREDPHLNVVWHEQDRGSHQHSPEGSIPSPCLPSCVVLRVPTSAPALLEGHRCPIGLMTEPWGHSAVLRHLKQAMTGVKPPHSLPCHLPGRHRRCDVSPEEML